jgi:hypothetical protein
VRRKPKMGVPQLWMDTDHELVIVYPDETIELYVGNEWFISCYLTSELIKDIDTDFEFTCNIE